jgi:hypothetical protein
MQRFVQLLALGIALVLSVSVDVGQVVYGQVKGVPPRGTTASSGDVLKRSELCAPVDGMPGEGVLQTTIDVGPGMTLDAVVEVTAKGNGVLSIANLRLRVVDEHDDGIVYKDGWAHTEFVDLNNDGWKDLVVLGSLVRTREAASESPGGEPFVFIYLFDAEAMAFVRSYKHATFELAHKP